MTVDRQKLRALLKAFETNPASPRSISTAIDALPALLDELDAADQEIERLRGALTIVGCWDDKDGDDRYCKICRHVECIPHNESCIVGNALAPADTTGEGK